MHSTIRLLALLLKNYMSQFPMHSERNILECIYINMECKNQFLYKIREICVHYKILSDPLKYKMTKVQIWIIHRQNQGFEFA